MDDELDDEITEMTTLIAHRVDGVTSPANGMPFLVMKSLDDPAEVARRSNEELRARNAKKDAKRARRKARKAMKKAEKSAQASRLLELAGSADRAMEVAAAIALSTDERAPREVNEASLSATKSQIALAAHFGQRSDLFGGAPELSSPPAPEPQSFDLVREAMLAKYGDTPQVRKAIDDGLAEAAKSF